MDKRTILLVEDNPDDVDLTLRAFKQNNILNKVIVVEDGQEALDYLFARNDFAGREQSTDPVVVLLDLKLPKISGLEVLKQMKQNDRTKLIPVVILTSSNEEKDLIDSYTLNASSFIRKPVDFLRFSEAVKQLELYWLVLNEPAPHLKAD